MIKIEHRDPSDSLAQHSYAEQVNWLHFGIRFYYYYNGANSTVQDETVCIWRVKPKRQLPETSRGPRYSFTYIPNE